MKKTIILLFLLFTLFQSKAQDVLNLTDCYDLAIHNYPLIQQKGLLKKYEENRLNLLGKRFLPTINLNLQASYQSDVTALSIDDAIARSMGMQLPDLSKDQYKANLNIQQLIWDGGINREQKKIERIDTKLKEQNLEVELYKIKDQINQLFFNNMLLEKQIKILSLGKENLLNNIKTLTQVIEQGMALISELNILEAEVISIDQQLTELKHNRIAVLQMLSEYIGKEIELTQKFNFDEVTLSPDNNTIERPEIKGFELSRLKLEANMARIEASKSPMISGSGQLGYGRPALNMLSNNFDPYYKIGINLSWNLWDNGQKKSDKSLLKINSEINKTQQESFEHNIHIKNKQTTSNVQKLEEFLSQDKKIIELRTNIRSTAESQLKKGSLTSADYLTELNKETQSKLNFEYHKIQLALAKLNLKYNLGQL